MAHSQGRGEEGEGGGDIFRKAEAAVHSLFTLSGSVCPTQPRPRNPPPPNLPATRSPFLLLVSPPPRPNDRFFVRQRSEELLRSNGHWNIFHRPNREGRGWTKFRVEFLCWKVSFRKGSSFRGFGGEGRNLVEDWIGD